MSESTLTLTLVPTNFPFESKNDGEYGMRLCVAACDKFRKENDCAIIFKADFYRETDEEAIEVAKKIAKRIGCYLDLCYFDDSFVHYEKEM